MKEGPGRRAEPGDADPSIGSVSGHQLVEPATFGHGFSVGLIR